MDKNKFRHHFDNALTSLIDFTKTQCFNELTNKFSFFIIPNGRTPHNGLSENEIQILALLNEYKDKLISADQVIQLLCQDNKVPLWINTEVYESRPDRTIINLITSRRFREDKDLFYKVDQYPPFHLWVPLPPDPLRIERNGKYDINWKKRLDDKQKPTSIFKQLVGLFNKA